MGIKNIKGFLIALILLFSCFTTKAQSVDRNIADKIIELKSSGIDTIVYYHIKCVGYKSVDTCDRGVAYLVWKKENESYIQAFDKCNTDKSQKINPGFMGFLTENVTKIRLDSVYYPQYETLENGKKHEFTTFIDHSCIYSFDIYAGKLFFKKTIDDYALETKYVNEKYLNKNFDRLCTPSKYGDAYHRWLYH
ncbi:MAG: hypothetical protein EOO07_35305 [Chitinophagaceae bacterium]|nr:MAG: hypothetical protein EOO07_35305 [Chitinophagaceae bacterium]